MRLFRRLTGDSPEHPTAAVVRNLERVLNAVKGYGSVVRDFGLGEYDGELATSSALVVLAEEMTAAVQRYERRLEAPRLEVLGRAPGGWIHFHLDGRVAGEAQAFRVRFHALRREVRVSAEGHDELR